MHDYSKVIGEVDEPVIVANENGVVVYINQLFSTTFIWDSSTLIGEPISTIIPFNLRDAHNMGFSRYKMSGKSTILDMALDLEILTGDGKVLLARHLIQARMVDGKKLFVASIVPREL